MDTTAAMDIAKNERQESNNAGQPAEISSDGDEDDSLELTQDMAAMVKDHSSLSIAGIEEFDREALHGVSYSLQSLAKRYLLPSNTQHPIPQCPHCNYLWEIAAN
jgi:hypothetical protein